MGGDGLGEFRDLIDALDDVFVDLAQIAERLFAAGAHHFADFLALAPVALDALLESFDGFLLDLGDPPARVLGVTQTGQKGDEPVHALLDARVEIHDVLAPFGEALLALGDVVFEIHHRLPAGLDVVGGGCGFLGDESGYRNDDRQSSDEQVSNHGECMDAAG